MIGVNCACVLIGALLLPNIVTGEKPLLKTRLGLIQGLEADDGDYYMFLGIPYAKINESNLFGESLPHPPFDTIFEANDDSIMCPQREEFNQTIQGTINCLTLNIYVPKTANSTNKLPVLLYVYGGNYIVGFNGRYMYGPKYLVRHDIIIVVFNYRLGPYGFLCLDIPEVPGNQGYKDQKNALRWVYNYIEEFGGDRNKITLDGHSFGAISVDLLLHSMNENEKLFDKVILQSEGSLSPYAKLQRLHEKSVLKMARHLGTNTNDVRQAITFLSSVNSSLVIEASLKVSIVYSDCIEKTFNNAFKSMSNSDWNIKVPGAKNVSFMIGNTENELIHVYGLDIPEISRDLDQILRSSKYSPLTAIDTYEIAKIIHGLSKMNGMYNRKIRNKLSQYVGKMTYLRISKLNMLKYLRGGARNVFNYMFSYEGQRNFLTNKLNLTLNEGATHADEISYLFDLFYMVEPSQGDRLIIDRMTTLWANFVKYG
uniref:Esterase n=2 Tax=Manduca sexta TaxID=7130 RepID=A0A977XKR0_MANSE|nr:esterase [Manduca sexta]